MGRTLFSMSGEGGTGRLTIAAALPAVRAGEDPGPAETIEAAWDAPAAVEASGPLLLVAPEGTADALAGTVDAGAVLAPLLGAIGSFGRRVQAVRIAFPDGHERDDALLERLLAAWPRDLRLALDLADPTWEDDAVHARLRDAGVALVATDRPGVDEPVLRRLAPFLYLRLLRPWQTPMPADKWRARIAPFLADGCDVIVVLGHADPEVAERIGSAPA